MYLTEQILTGLSGLLLHKLRSALTMLGIIFGVGAVVSMVAIGEGAKEEALRQIESFGARTIYVKAIDVAGDKMEEAKLRGMNGLCFEDRDYLLESCSFITRGAPQILIDEKVSYHGKQPNSKVVGVDSSYSAITGSKPFRGRFITDDDVRYQRNICVLGWDVYRELFIDTPALGRDLSIGDLRFHIVGIMPCTATTTRVKQGKSAGGQIKTRNVDRDVYIPVSTAQEQYRAYSWNLGENNDPFYHRVKEMILEIDATSNVPAGKEAVKKLLTARHGLEDIEVVAPLEILEQSRKAQNLFNMVLAAIAGLSLLVGGIGIMNIMLANVSERTREIGIRRSVGATQEDILIQFLVEALCVSFIGGMLGIFLGYAIALGASEFLELQAKFTLWATVLAFVVASGVGIVFGIIPARVAAKLDPVTALRYE